jgi:SpoVK/Ycf46/Vps4 family AAA+-type ATPase
MKIGKTTTNISVYENKYGNDWIYPTSKQKSFLPLEANIYNINADANGELFVAPKEINFEKFIELPHMPTNDVMSDLDIFWKAETKDKYEKFGLIYKRGILMHGKPGVGKSASIYKICQNFVQQGGIVFYDPQPAALYMMVKQIQVIEPERRILAVFEEVEHLIRDTTFLSILDGEKQLNNVAYIATTNYIKQIPERIKNRPSRFARVIEVGFPSLVDRKTYLSHVLGNVIDTKTLNEVAELTEGFVLDQVKDVVISHFVFDYSLDISIEKIRSSWDEEDLDVEEEEEYEDDEEEALPARPYGR